MTKCLSSSGKLDTIRKLENLAKYNFRTVTIFFSFLANTVYSVSIITMQKSIRKTKNKAYMPLSNTAPPFSMQSTTSTKSCSDPWNDECPMTLARDIDLAKLRRDKSQ